MEMIKKLGLLALIIACVAAGYIAMKKYYASHENVKVQGFDKDIIEKANMEICKANCETQNSDDTSKIKTCKHNCKNKINGSKENSNQVDNGLHHGYDKGPISSTPNDIK